MLSPQTCLLAAILVAAALATSARGQDITSVPQPAQSAPVTWNWASGQWVLINGAYQWQAGHWVSAPPTAGRDTTPPYVWIPSHWEYLPSGGWVDIEGHYALATPGMSQPPPLGPTGEAAQPPFPDQSRATTAVPSRPLTPQQAYDAPQAYDASVGLTSYNDNGVGYYGAVDPGWGFSSGWGGYGAGGYGYGYGYGYGCENGGCSRVVVPRSCYPYCGNGAWNTTGGGGWVGGASPNPYTTTGSGGWGVMGPGPYGQNPWRLPANPGVRTPATPMGPNAPMAGRPMTPSGHSTSWEGRSSRSAPMTSGSGMGFRGMSMGNRGSFSGGRR